MGREDRGGVGLRGRDSNLLRIGDLVGVGREDRGGVGLRGRDSNSSSGHRRSSHFSSKNGKNVTLDKQSLLAGYVELAEGEHTAVWRAIEQFRRRSSHENMPHGWGVMDSFVEGGL